MIALLLAAALAAAAPAERRPVDVRAGGDAALTLKLSDALTKSLASASRLRAMAPEDDDDLTLVILGDVTPDGARFDYIVDLLKTNGQFAPKRVASISGKCRETAIDACAAEIVARADRKVRKDA